MMSKRKLNTLDSWVQKGDLSKTVAVHAADDINGIVDLEAISTIEEQAHKVKNDPENLEVIVSPAVGPQRYALSPPPFIVSGKVYNFQTAWLGSFKWTQLNEDGTKILCKECKSAYEKKIFSPKTTIQHTFISKGFGNWQLGAGRLRMHEDSDQHVDAVTRLGGLKSPSIVTKMSTKLKDSQETARKSLEVIITSAKFLAKQGLAFRGHVHDSGNFQELIKLRAHDVPKLEKWLEKDRNFTSWKIQNEIIAILSHKIQRRLVDDLKKSKEFCLIADETSDNSGREQVSICVRIVDDDLCPQEHFLGLYEVASTTADNLKEVILDALKRFQLPLENLRAQCYDGAKNMSGIHRGVAAQILKLQPLGVYVHCYAHSLNLAIQDTIKQIPFLRDTMGVVQEISVIVRASPKRLAQFKSISFEDGTSSGLLPKPMCPTRFLLRARSVRAVIENYGALLEQLEGLSAANENVSRTAHGLCAQLQKGEVYFGMLLCLEILTLVEDLSKAIQKPSVSLGSILETVSVVRKTLLSRQEDKYFFEHLWTKMEAQVELFDLEKPQLPRFRKPTPKMRKTMPKRFDSAREMLHHFYKEAYNLANEEINQRFSQEGIQKYVQMESLLLEKDDKTENFITLLNSVCADYQLDADRLLTNLKMLKFSDEKFKSVQNVVDFLKGLQASTKVMYGELFKLVKLLLLFPVSSCTPERSFSVLKRVKTYLRTTMSQERLNHCCIVNTYSERVDEIDIKEIVSEFINSDSRVQTFGPAKL